MTSSIDFRVLAKFSRGFRLLEALVFAPLTAVVGQMLRGKVVVDSTALIHFFLSPRGFFATILSATLFLTLRWMEHAGLAVLVEAQAAGRRPTAGWAFQTIFVRSHALLRAALVVLGAALALVTPLAISAGLFSHQLLSQHDINFYLDAKPPVFVGAAVFLAVVALVTLAAGVWLALRWRWVVQVLMFERCGVLDAFRRSAALARPVWPKIAGRWLMLGVVNLVLGAAAAWVGRLILPLGLGILGEGRLSLGFILGGLLILQAIIGALFSMVGAILEAVMFTRLYFNTAGRSPETANLNVEAAEIARKKSLWVPVSAAVILILAGGGLGAVWGSRALFAERPVLVIAHRASLTDAPENTVPAIEQAIQDGADVAEIDVQLSRDGVVVLAHDSDFSRTAGVARRVADLTWNEIQQLDVGRSFPEKLHGTRPARLEEILSAARGRIRLNIEFKHYAPVDGQLEEKTLRLVEQSTMTEQVEVQSLEFESLAIVRRLNPNIRTGYLMSVNARQPEKLDVDFLSVQMSRVNARFLRRAHRHDKEVYVWTVDNDEQVEKALALGVDGVITNRSQAVSTFLKNWAQLTPNKKALHRLKIWLAR